jgi:uncharacterized protein with beta-barrel porin domain
MTLLALPEPPNPQDAQYVNNSKAYNLAMYRWAQNMKSQLTVDSRTHNRPASTPFTVTGFTTATSLTGTDSTTNVAQVLCTLISTLIGKGTLSNKPNNQ